MSAGDFRKRPVVIQAWQATGTREMIRIVKWIESHEGSAAYRTPVNFGPAIDILTLEGTMECSKDDWVIRGVQGEFYPCKPDIFDTTYEPVQRAGSPLAVLREQIRHLGPHRGAVAEEALAQVDALVQAADELGLWEPGRRGYAAAHNRLFAALAPFQTWKNTP